MSVSKWLLIPVLALTMSSSGIVRAADTDPPAYLAAGPVASGAYCPTCDSGVGGYVSGVGTCKSCGSARCSGSGCGQPLLTSLHNSMKKPQPYVTNLRPGACFGYFQTQWRKWDEVCPYPYLGTGVSDNPKPPTPYLPSASDRFPTKKPDGTLPDPRPVDPKKTDPMPMPMKKPGSDLPPIPVPGRF